MARIIDPRELEMKALDELVDLSGMRVLDVGCGDGRTARRIARTARSVVGIDPDPERIALALKEEPEEGSCRVEFRVEDAVTIDFSSVSLDAVVFTRSL